MFEKVSAAPRMMQLINVFPFIFVMFTYTKEYEVSVHIHMIVIKQSSVLPLIVAFLCFVNTIELLE